MRASRQNTPVRAAALLLVAALTLTLLSGCAVDRRKVLTGITQQELSAGGEPYFNVGGITYQVQESRQLNPYSDDVDYFYGLKNAQSLPGSEFWFGVFLWAKNQNPQTLTTSSHITLSDSAGNTYTPVKLDPSLNPFAWSAQPLSQNAIEPNPDSIAASDSAQGDLVLFQLPESTYQNRPLTLHIYPQGSSSKAAAVSLDL